jgi:hypothetical protein
MTLLLRQPPQHQIHIHLLGCLDRLRATLDVSALVRIDVLSAWAGKRLDALLAVESAVRVRVLGAEGRKRRCSLRTLRPSWRCLFKLSVKPSHW